MLGERHRDRLLQGDGAVLSVTAAAALLPVADSEARAWLHAQGLVRYLCGRPVVHWGAVTKRIDASGRLEAEQPVQPVRLPRAAL